jgi:hypothetical protein
MEKTFICISFIGPCANESGVQRYQTFDYFCAGFSVGFLNIIPAYRREHKLAGHGS